MKIATRILKSDKWKITSKYGYRIHPKTKLPSFHSGIDFGTQLEHWNVYGLEKGIVTASNYDDRNGNYIWIEYPRLDLKLFHCHLLNRQVNKGDIVNENTVIGQVGKTGGLINGIQYKLGVHLHLGVKHISDNKYFDFENYDYQELVKNADDLKSIDHATLKKGDIVKVIGTHWATGSKIPLWVKLNKYEIVKLNEKSALLKGVNSWANLKDLKKV